VEYKIISQKRVINLLQTDYSKKKATLQKEALKRVKDGEQWAEVVECTGKKRSIYFYDRYDCGIRFSGTLYDKKK
jgi:hypothetical protein